MVFLGLILFRFPHFWKRVVEGGWGWKPNTPLNARWKNRLELDTHPSSKRDVFFLGGKMGNIRVFSIRRKMRIKQDICQKELTNNHS